MICSSELFRNLTSLDNVRTALSDESNDRLASSSTECILSCNVEILTACLSRIVCNLSRSSKRRRVSLSCSFNRF